MRWPPDRDTERITLIIYSASDDPKNGDVMFVTSFLPKANVNKTSVVVRRSDNRSRHVLFQNVLEEKIDLSNNC